jgi:hypothetical protein
LLPSYFDSNPKEDQFGRDIRLTNGNVASRILPIRIHDLDAEDNSTLEKKYRPIKGRQCFSRRSFFSLKRVESF